MKRKDTKPVGTTEGGDGQPGMIAVKDIHTHPMFVDLLPIGEDLIEKMIHDMTLNGYYESEPMAEDWGSRCNTNDLSLQERGSYSFLSTT